MDSCTKFEESIFQTITYHKNEMQEPETREASVTFDLLLTESDQFNLEVGSLTPSPFVQTHTSVLLCIMKMKQLDFTLCCVFHLPQRCLGLYLITRSVWDVTERRGQEEEEACDVLLYLFVIYASFFREPLGESWLKSVCLEAKVKEEKELGDGDEDKKETRM